MARFRFEAQARLLAGAPGIGRPRGDLRPGPRSSVVGSYLIFYRAAHGGIEIVRVLHGRRDIEAAFGDEGSSWRGQTLPCRGGNP